ncbi:MAG TPA: NAD(P)-dependent oxidoreductase [Burkholderiales bacterium]|jgi:3-hydroxyisobutyrate dehydrogenase-like beta-hydroxyacid dehydrogenase|nr:NAD(P)-dependent oxidoreductase [Burkholderiales bacterium]
MSTVAFIGVGAMGSRMAMNLHSAGHELRVFNRSKEKTKQFTDKGIRIFDSPAEAAKGAEFVCSIVSDDVATREVMLGASGVLAGAAKGTIILDSSTNTPAMAREVAKAAAAKGVVYLDCPVSGSLAQAQGKELVILVGGDKAAFDKAQGVLSAMGRMVRRIGDSGAGATLKLINNMISASLTATLGEAALAAEAANLDKDAALEILAEGAAGCRLTKTKLPKIFKRDFAPQFQLELMDKDLRYFLALAQELDRPAPIASLIRSQYQAAKRADLGKLDSCAVFLQAAGERPKA